MFVQNQLLIAGRLAPCPPHAPVALQRVCLLKLSVRQLQWGCIEQLFLVRLVDGHWITLRLGPSPPPPLGVNGGVGWPGPGPVPEQNALGL